MSLSPELRNRIYDLALHPQEDGEGGVKGCRAICISVNKKLQSKDPESGDVLMWTKQPALIKVCRQVRSETLPIYYGVIHSHARHEVLQRSQNPVTGSQESEDVWGPPIDPRALEGDDCRWAFNFQGAERLLQRVGPANRALIEHVNICHVRHETDSPLGGEHKREWIGKWLKTPKEATRFERNLARHMGSQQVAGLQGIEHFGLTCEYENDSEDKGISRGEYVFRWPPIDLRASPDELKKPEKWRALLSSQPYCVAYHEAFRWTFKQGYF